MSWFVRKRERSDQNSRSLENCWEEEAGGWRQSFVRREQKRTVHSFERSRGLRPRRSNKGKWHNQHLLSQGIRKSRHRERERRREDDPPILRTIGSHHLCREHNQRKEMTRSSMKPEAEAMSFGQTSPAPAGVGLRRVAPKTEQPRAARAEPQEGENAGGRKSKS